MYITERIAAELQDDTHAALITGDISRRYATGFSSSAGIVFVTKHKSYLIIDGRYYEKASQQAKGCEVQLLTDLRKQVYAIIEEHGIEVVSIESKTVTVSELEDYKKLFNALVVDSSPWLSVTLERMRIIKSEEEILKIEAAQRIAEAAFSKLITSIRVGMTEKQVATVLNFYMMDLGADGISFDTIAASGVNSACPHAVPTDKPLQNGEFLTLDFGAVVDSYHSDMIRTVVIGKPDEEMKNIYNAVWGANTDALKAVRADITGKLLDNVARSTLDAWGYEKYFSHGLGHGVGLEIHEAPTISPKSAFTLREGMVITIEPGAYIPNKYGVRIEDMVVVTSDGCLNLTKTPKTLIYI
ncbi:MAG: aminopeptidase P family protein [Ruminiclostridium sp.]|nr:aminopeptidase P family protein [Ruminiclostridium sp.]